jgi:hypothetical protein
MFQAIANAMADLWHRMPTLIPPPREVRQIIILLLSRTVVDVEHPDRKLRGG